MTPEDLVGQLAEPARLRLADAGVLTSGADGWSVDDAALRRAARDTRPSGEPDGGRLAPFVVGRRLLSMPASGTWRVSA